MKRRTFIAGLGSAAAWPVVAQAQQTDRVRRIGVLLPSDENDPRWKTWVSAFTQALADLGWTDGREVQMDLQWGRADSVIFRVLPVLAHPIKLSHECIYQMIWQDKRDGGDLWRCLRRRGKRYNKCAGKNAGRGMIPNRIDISERPAIVVRKTRLEDWEGDTVVSAGRKGGLLTLVERKTKLIKIAKLPRATARATQKAAVRRLKPIADFVHTITFDNGKEFATHQDITHALKATIFFATPYQVAKVERLLNARPRKSLGFRSPQEVFHSLAYS
jgi:IS30 family transposase